MFSALDWLPTLVEIAGGPKGNELNKQIKAGQYKGIVKTKLDGVNQLDYLTGKSEKSARDTFFYYTGPIPSAVRYKNWKFYYTMMGSRRPSAACCRRCPTNGRRSRTSCAIRSRQTSGQIRRALMSVGGALAAPSTAYLYDWNLLPIGQMLWEKELMSYKDFPPLQQAASYNLDQVLQSIRDTEAQVTD